MESNKPKSQGWNTFLTIILGLAAICLIFYSFWNYDQANEFSIFTNLKFKKQSQKIKAITTISFSFSTILVILIAIKYILINLFNKVANDTLVEAFRTLVQSQLQSYVMFMSLYAYALFHNVIEKKALNIFPNLFFVGSIAYIFGFLLRSRTNFNFDELGQILMMGVNLLLIGQIIKLNPLSAFQ